jgi:hypothetical protein
MNVQRVLCIAWSSIWVSLCLGQTEMHNPIKTTVCEIVQSPQTFSGKLVKLNARVIIAFEDFELSASACEGKRINGVWLEYGRGPKKQPTTWCCGDLTPRDPLTLLENDAFRRFDHYLTAQRRTKGCYEGQCYLYEVTATLTGRFDSVQTESCPNGKDICCKGGFGHFGFFCGRLVVQSVSDVVATPTPPLRPVRYR